MKIYCGYMLFQGNLQVNGEDASAFLIKVKDAETGKMDGMIMSCHPGDVDYIRAAFQTVRAVGVTTLSQRLLDELHKDGLIIVPGG